MCPSPRWLSAFPPAGACLALVNGSYYLAIRRLPVGVALTIQYTGPLMVLISLGFAYAVLYEASLSFLGLGAQAPTPEWGVMLSTARDFLFQAPWYAFFPGLSIVILVFSLNLVGDGLRDAIDPHRARR